MCWTNGISAGTLFLVFASQTIIGSFSNDEGDGNEDVKKAIGLDWQNNNFARASRFLHISLPSLHDNEVKMPNCKFYGGRKQATANLFFFL